jgi:hypothetical protein
MINDIIRLVIKMIKQLIVNADDFGMCEGNTIGILLAHKNGIVTSTTVMMNMPYALFGLKQAQKFPDLGIGVHLNITIGKSLTNPKGITDSQGYFYKRDTYKDRIPIVDKDDLYKEWKAQIDEYIKVCGHLPTHIDSHHHVHLQPMYIDVSKRLSEEYHIPMRQRTKVCDPYIKCIDSFEEDNVSYDYLFDLFNNHEEALELMCHPGLIDQRLCDISSYNLKRMKELEILTSDKMKQYIKDHHIQLINYKNT